MFEHPAGASSWELTCVKRMIQQKDVHKVNFDTCRAGLTTNNKDGEEKPSRKRTSILTKLFTLRAPAEANRGQRAGVGGDLPAVVSAIYRL